MAKTPDDFVTVDLATHKLVHFQATEYNYKWRFEETELRQK